MSNYDEHGNWNPPRDNRRPLPLYPHHCAPEDVAALVCRLEALADPAQQTPGAEPLYSQEAIDAAVAAERERCAKLPRLPTPRVLASGTIAGKAIELRGWHTDDIEIWERQHGLKFGA